MEGYPKLALLQGANQELNIFRNFGYLNARNVLYLQAELIDLEDRLKRHTESDLNGGGNRSKYSRNWFKLSRSKEDGADVQWHTMLLIREKLKEYNATLLQLQELAKLEKPYEQDVAFLKEWLDRKDGGNCTLEGNDRHFLESHDDLISLAPAHPFYPFSRLIRGPLTDGYHKLLGAKTRKPIDAEAGIYRYKDASVVRIANIIGVLVSGLLPLASIVALYYVHEMGIRIGLVAVFTSLFSLALALMTKSEGVEIFAATAAFAGVQVVFIGSVVN